MKVVIITTLYLTKMHYFATLHTCKNNIKNLTKCTNKCSLTPSKP